MALAKKDNGIIPDDSMRRLIDPETGEEVWVQGVEKTYYGQKHFWKLYLFDFLAVLGVLNSKQLDIVAWICEHTSPSSNVLIATQEEIAEGCGASRMWVSETMKKLMSANFIKRRSPGVYMLNPDVMMKGGEAKKRGLMITYREDSSIETRAEAERMGCLSDSGMAFVDGDGVAAFNENRLQPGI